MNNPTLAVRIRQTLQEPYFVKLPAEHPGQVQLSCFSPSPLFAAFARK